MNGGYPSDHMANIAYLNCSTQISKILHMYGIVWSPMEYSKIYSKEI